MIRNLPNALLTVFLLMANCDITAETTATASGQPAPAAASTIRFDGQRAMVDLVKQVDGGPRLPNSPGILATRELITSTLTQAGWEVHTQDFTADSPMLKQNVPGQNIFALYPKGSTATLVLSAHYDTRPYADMDPDPAKRMDPVPGANDGGSGVAVLLELGRIIPQISPQQGIALVFFDLEDHGAPGDNMGYCLGSRYFASNLPPQVKDFQQGINVDMVADKDLKLPMEGFSMSKAPRLTAAVWRIGNRFYPNTFIMERGGMIYDDHVPFQVIGKQYIDIIDIQYQPWHTTADTPDKCSPQSLEIVGDTLLRFIRNLNN